MKNIVAVSLDTVHTSKLINEKVIININTIFYYINIVIKIRKKGKKNGENFKK